MMTCLVTRGYTPRFRPFKNGIKDFRKIILTLFGNYKRRCSTGFFNSMPVIQWQNEKRMNNKLLTL